MVFQSKTWNWKSLAARLLLVPVVAGSTAGALKAQSFQSSWQNGSTGKPSATAPKTPAPKATAPTAAASANATSSDPVSLLKDGRKALAEGKIDVARDCAAKADQAATSKGYKWGLFEDTPNSLRKDVVTASAKADKAQAVDLFKKAKAVCVQKVSSDEEKLANLDTAMAMAVQAQSLYGAQSMWEFGDKPANLIADIKTAQEILRKKTGIVAKTAAPSPVGPSTTTAKLPSPNMPNSPTSPVSLPMTGTAALTANPAKMEVLKVVGEGRILLAQDKVLEAKDKAVMARTLAEQKGALNAFTASDDTPDALLTAAKAKGTEMVKSLMLDADKQMSLTAYDRADAALAMAANISTGLGFSTRQIDEKKVALTKFSKNNGVMTAAATVAATTAPVAPAMTPKMPETLVPVAGVANPPANAKNMMLESAANEMKAGNLDMARTMCVQAFNTGNAASKTEAQAMLRQIDAEMASRKRMDATTAMTNAMTAYGAKDYAQCKAVLSMIDPSHLTPDMKAKCDLMMLECTAKSNGIRQASGDDLKAGMTKLGGDVKVANETPNALVNNPVADTAKGMADVAFDKFRSEAIEAEKAASAAWGNGETDAAMKILDEYSNKVKGSSLPPGRQAMLLKSINNRLDAYSRLKHNTDYTLREAKDKIDTRNKMVGDRVAEAQKQDEIQKKVAEVGALQKAAKFKEAESLALQVKSMDPDNATLTAVYEAAKYRRRNEDNKAFAARDEQFNLDAWRDAENRGPYVDTNDPLKVNPEVALRAAARGEEAILRSRSPKTRELEGKLSASYPLMKFENMPLKDVLQQIREKANINIVIDEPTLEDEKLSLEAVTINDTLKDLSLDSSLKILLQKARLVYIIEDDVVKVTTEKRTKGRMKTKVFHVMDLVTPIPEYKLADHQRLDTAMAATKALPPAIAGATGGNMPRVPSNGLTGGEMVSGGAGSSGTPFLPGSNGGSITSNAIPTATPGQMAPQRTQYAEQLKRLVTGMIRPYSWSDNGSAQGAGTIAYYDIGGAMVVNQTADVISEVEQLLNSLRRLQDLSVAVEMRVISLSETFFERIGVDFQANITTHNTSFERSLTTSSFAPEPFVNRINASGTTVGYSPATGISSDLNVPVRATSYPLTAPPFGGYQNALSPTLNGGLSLGLAFLNDIQVYMFLEAAAGNRRINIMQAPKITLFNGQTSTVFVGDLAYFATGLQVFNVGGQFVYLPVNQAFPIGNGNNPNGNNQSSQAGVSVTIQAVISADRRFVRMNLTPSLTALASATVPLFPITTFVTPVFEGGSQGQPIPFTQFFQQPSFTEISAQTTVAVPDGGTVLLGGLKTLAQGRNEFGPPVLSNVPYLNRLFKNVGVGQETRHVMLMVTPRIIINSEEEARQTGDGVGGALPPAQ
ncbi:hypothetical protein BH11PLA2_BH11PLA2_03910 [soil metagenome]